MNESIVEMKTVILGGGCFWCIEAVFKNIKGVERIEPGYAGGDKPFPTYKEVCSGTTGYAEVIKLTFDASVLQLEEILMIFFTAHDPTTLNRQGNDVGPQYRSCIFYQSKEERMVAEKIIEEYSVEGTFDDPIVTEVAPLKNYFPAEDYHKDYYYNHQAESYCRIVISPKVDKVKEKFRHLLKSN